MIRKMVRKAEAGSPSAIAHTCDADTLGGDCAYSAKACNSTGSHLGRFPMKARRTPLNSPI